MRVAGMLNKNSKRARIALVGCALAVTTCGGCRSATPRLNLFGWNREPSAEALAGSGPTTTYPMPPSATAKPQAIESIAAGVTPPKTSPTAPAAPATRPGQTPSSSQIAGLNIDMGTPDTGRPAGSPAANLAAAQANGFLGSTQPSTLNASNPTPSGPSTAAADANPSAKGTIAAGMGAPATGSHPPGGTTPAAADSSTAPSYAMPSLASSGLGGPSLTHSAVAPPPNQGTTAGTTTTDNSVGFTLPPGMSPASSSTASAPTATTVQGSGTVASEPNATIASSRTGVDTAGSNKLESSDTSTASPASFVAPSGAYAPGSTSSGSAYPTGTFNPAGGSIYR